jgi:hypothetical protein
MNTRIIDDSKIYLSEEQQIRDNSSIYNPKTLAWTEAGGERSDIEGIWSIWIRML